MTGVMTQNSGLLVLGVASLGLGDDGEVLAWG